MRLIFAGTPEFAALSLRALLAADHKVELVLTQPDRQSGRGKKLRPSPVKEVAVEAGLRLYQPLTLRDPQAQARLAQQQVDAMVVAAYGLILPATILAMPRLGCINVHASLLPRWRGAAPIQRAVEAGDTETGITIMQMDAGLDTGPMLLIERLSIGREESGGSVHDRLALLGAQALVQALDALAGPGVSAQVQPDSGACYARRLTGEDAQINWDLPAYALVNRVRAFDPVPGSACRLVSDPHSRLNIWRLAPVAGATTSDARPGTVLSSRADLLRVACADGAVDILEMQRAGGRRLTVAQFQQGHPIAPGELLTGF